MSSVAVEPTFLKHIVKGMTLITNGNHVVEVPHKIVEAFKPGDKILAIERPLSTRDTKPLVDVLHIPKADLDNVKHCIDKACGAFEKLKNCSDEQISSFFRMFGEKLADDSNWEAIAKANKEDVDDATKKARSTTRLKVSDKMRANMIEGLNTWAQAESPRMKIVEMVPHKGWKCEVIQRELGPIAFVFEGRPNVLADAAGVIRSGNTVVLRIGSDAMRTASTIVERCVAPALVQSKLPDGTIELLSNPTHATSWALFSDSRLRLAVARGSGQTVDMLGMIAQLHGVQVSLHGTGGAWGIATNSAIDISQEVSDYVVASLDRKVCNTLNTICVPKAVATKLIPHILDGLKRAGEKLNTCYKLHAHTSAVNYLPDELMMSEVDVIRAEGAVKEKQVEIISDWALLGREWEWEGTPEVTLAVVADAEEAAQLFNLHSPHFIVSVWGTDNKEKNHMFVSLNSPFVGDSLTRWVDGQVALCKPELGLSSWEHGRLLGRPGILTGDIITSRALKRSSE